YDLVANFSNSDYGTQLVSQLADSSSFTTMTKAPEAVEISQCWRYNTQPTYEHTSEITAFYTYKTRNSLTACTFDRPVFVDLIPAITDGSAYNFLHDHGAITNTGRINFKHYWVLNSTNHIYPVAGLYYYHQTYNSTDFQRLQNGNINSFATAGFNNALSFQLIDPYIGFQYKFKLGDIVFRPGVIYQIGRAHV